MPHSNGTAQTHLLGAHWALLVRVPEAILVTALVAGLLLPSLFLHGEVPDHAP